MGKTKIPYKTYLTEQEMPKEWYNVRADMKTNHRPLLNPQTREPARLEELEAVFSTECSKQELNDVDAYIEIPEEVREFYKMYRPSPLKGILIRPQEFITNSRATTPAARINLTAQ